MQILKFYTDTCGQCKVVGAMLDKAGIQYENINAEKDEVMCETYNINHVPTVIVVDDDGSQKRLNNIAEVKQWLAHNK